MNAYCSINECIKLQFSHVKPLSITWLTYSVLILKGFRLISIYNFSTFFFFFRQMQSLFLFKIFTFIFSENMHKTRSGDIYWDFILNKKAKVIFLFLIFAIINSKVIFPEDHTQTFLIVFKTDWKKIYFFRHLMYIFKTFEKKKKILAYFSIFISNIWLLILNIKKENKLL